MEHRLKRLELDQLKQKEERIRKRKERMSGKQQQRCQSGDDGKRSEIGQQQRRIQGLDRMFSVNIGALSDDDDDKDHQNDDNDYDDFNLGSLSDIDNNNSDDSMFSDSEQDSTTDDDDHDEIEYELQHIQNQKAYNALLSLHQMEALWKVTKIELDRTVREACRWILAPTPDVAADAGSSSNGGVDTSGRRRDGGPWYAFCPSENSPYAEDWQQHYARPPPPPPPPPPPDGKHHHHHHHHHQSHRQNRRHHHHHHRRRRKSEEVDGWVGTNGEVVPMEVGRLRAAAAMVAVGDIMVKCSKEGTSWKKKN
jgi:hypothetical protein